MPWRLASPCVQPGCPERAIRAGRCATHQQQTPQRQYDAQRGSPSADGYDRKWSAFSKAYLKRNPFCVVCGEPANDVDHIIPLRDGGQKYWEGNLQSMCKSHHSVKTARENGGWGRGRQSRNG